MFKVFAQEEIQLGPVGGSDGKGLGLLGNLGSILTPDPSSAVRALGYITDIVSAIIGVMTVAAMIWFMFQFLVGGLNWITSAGDKSKLESARNRLTHAMIGLIIVVAGWAILALVGQFFGFNMLVDPAEVIEGLSSVLGGSIK